MEKCLVPLARCNGHTEKLNMRDFGVKFNFNLQPGIAVIVWIMSR